MHPLRLSLKPFVQVGDVRTAWHQPCKWRGVRVSSAMRGGVPLRVVRPRRHHAAGRPCVRPRWRRGRYLRAAADERAGFSERIDRLDPEDLSDTIVDRGHELGLAVDDAAEYGYPRLAVRSLGEDLSGKGAQLGGRDLRKELGDDPSVPGRLPSCCQGRGPLGEFPSSVGGEPTLAVGEGARRAVSRSTMVSGRAPSSRPSSAMIRRSWSAWRSASMPVRVHS